jgi:NADPH:quinone reductase-like Zn-dependent oxidoreductase
MAVQIAAAHGAEVTAVTSGRNAELVHSLGALQAIDYTTTDFTRNGVAYDVIFDTIGSLTFDKVRGSLKPKGWFLSAVLSGRDMLPRFGISQRIVGGEARESAAAIETLARMAEAGTLKPVIEGIWPMEEAAAAHSLVDTKRKRGAVVLAIA